MSGSFVGQITKMIEFRQEVSKTLNRMKGIVKWSNIKHVLEFSSCSLARDYSGCSKIKVNLGLVNIFEMLF